MTPGNAIVAVCFNSSRTDRPCSRFVTLRPHLTFHASQKSNHVQRRPRFRIRQAGGLFAADVLVERGSRRPRDRVSIAGSAAHLVELFPADFSGHAGLVCSIVQIGPPSYNAPTDRTKTGNSPPNIQTSVSGGCFLSRGATTPATPPSSTFTT